jgi:hypothetical protein
MSKKSKGGDPPKKKSTLTREVTTYSKASDGSTRTKYPKKVSSSGAVSQLTRTTTPIKKKKS